MPALIAIVDQRLDLLEFLKEQIEARGYSVITAFNEDETDTIEPVPDLILLDFEPKVDLADVFSTIEEALERSGK